MRLYIAKKNVGRLKYSFNAMQVAPPSLPFAAGCLTLPACRARQRKLLPTIYQPPLHTINDVLTSVINRDS